MDVPLFRRLPAVYVDWTPKGRGVFANRDFEVGECAFVDPVVTVVATPTADGKFTIGNQEKKWTSSECEQQIYELIKAHVVKEKWDDPLVGLCCVDSKDPCRANAILAAHLQVRRVGQLQVFSIGPRATFVNHSCSANAFVAQDGSIVCARAIAKGLLFSIPFFFRNSMLADEEITVTYFSPHDNLFLHYERQERRAVIVPRPFFYLAYHEKRKWIERRLQFRLRMRPLLV